MLESKYDLCLSGSKHRTMAAGVDFSAHSGAKTASKPRIAVEGCGPAATASLRRPAGRRGRLSVTAERHPDGQNISAMTIRLPRGMKLVRSKVRGSVVSADGAKFVVRPKSSRRLEVSASAKQGAKRVVVRLRRGAIRLTGKVGQAVRKGKTRKLRLRVVTVDTGGQKFVSSRDCQGQAQVGGEMMTRVSRTSLIAGALVLACLAVPGVAAAAVSIDSYKITSDMPAFRTRAERWARRPPRRARIRTPAPGRRSRYPNATEDLKTALTNFAPGLLGNPESVPKCPEAALQAGRRRPARPAARSEPRGSTS